MTNGVRIPQLRSFCALLLFVAVNSAWALDPHQPMSSYIRTLDHGRAGHFGLPGMRERAKLIGGSLEVRSKAGSGSVVELAIASSIAYVKSPATRHWFFDRFRRK